MTPDSKSRRNVYPDVTFELIHEQVATQSSSIEDKAKRKEAAEKPLYLKRM